MEQNLTQYVDTLFNNMKTFSQEDGLIGKPVIQGDKTFLPVISITLGYGGGDSQSQAGQGTAATGKGRMMGDALGVGAKLCTDAVIVIDQGTVSVAPIGAKGGMSQVIDKIPQMLGNMGGGQQVQQGQQKQPGQQGQTSY